MLRIGFTGTPGSGKTSTARAFSANCRRIPSFERCELVAEYARQYISKYGDIEKIWEQVRLLNKQIGWEDSIPSAETDILITDSPITMNFAYSMLLSEGKPKDVMILNDLFKILNKLNNPPRYDLIFHLPPVLKPVVDGVRPECNFDEHWRMEMDKKILATFVMFPPRNFVTIKSVELNDRVEECLEHLRFYSSFQPFSGLTSPPKENPVNEEWAEDFEGSIGDRYT